MEILMLLAFILIIILFFKFGSLKRNLNQRIVSLEQAIDRLKGQVGPSDQMVGETIEAETAEGTEGAGETEPEIYKTAEPAEDELERERVSVPEDIEPEPPPLPEFQAEKETSVAVEAPVVITRKPRRESEWTAQWKKFKANVDWEQFTGVKLISWIGWLALFIGAIYFVKLAIEKDWLTAEMRLAIGALTGLGLIVVSFILNRIRYNITRHTLAAGGIAILYTVIFAATLYYQFIPKPWGFLLLTVVSASAFVLSLHHKGITISILGALGAYATPFLVDPGQGNLITLFIYLAVVNIGLFQVMKRLDSSMLLLVATAGTLVSLSIGSFPDGDQIPALTIAWIWIANLALFTIITDRLNIPPDQSQSVSWAGNILYLSIIILSFVFILFQYRNEASFLLLSAGTAGSMILAYRKSGWHKRVIPYSVLTFIIAVIWVPISFNPGADSWAFLIFLLYGVFAGFGPVLLIKKYGMEKSFLFWFRVFPIAVAALSMAALFKEPNVSFWFWPMALGLQVLGIFISLIFGAVIQLGILVLILVISGLTWIVRVPSEAVGLGFYGFLLFAGAILCVVIFFAIRKLPGWINSLNAAKEHIDPLKSKKGLIEWMVSSPAVGGFLLLAASFLIQENLNPHPGMATMVCFLGLTLFLCKRLSFQPLGMVALLAAVFTEAVWMITTENTVLNYSTLKWAMPLFIAALIMPFTYFRLFKKWNRIWMAFALFEVFQGIFIIWAADHLWPREYSGWTPMLLFLLKLPCVAIMMKKLRETNERNAIIAFHGGVLLFYISAIPVLLLDYGWIGLTLVYESMALLWLNRRVEHPGLRWVSVFMAPAGMVLLFIFLPDMKNPESLNIFNSAVLSVAAAVAALSFSVRLSPFPDRFLRKLEIPNYFLWLALGCGFGLLNLIVADIFASSETSFRFLAGEKQLQSICYSLVWAAFGSILWKTGALTKAMRMAGLTILCLAFFRIIFFPFIYPDAIPEMVPIFNLGLLAYLPLFTILLILYLKEPAGEKTANVKNLFLLMLLIVSFVGIKLEKSTLFQTGETFALFSSHTLSMAVASAFGWLTYGLGLLIWPGKLDKNFRIAGFALFLLGLGKASALPFRFRMDFGAIPPLLNTPTLLFAVIVGVITWLALRKNDNNWPIKMLNRRAFWGVLLAVVIFYFMNIEIASAFGIQGNPFSLITHGGLSHQLGYSLGWLIFSTGMLITGIRLTNSRVRWASLILYMITSLKIFFIDLSSLEQLYRVASLIGLAGVAILVSIIYQRFIVVEENHETGK